MLCLQENGFHNGGLHETNDVVYNNGSYEVPTFMKVRDLCCMCSLKRFHLQLHVKYVAELIVTETLCLFTVTYRNRWV